MKSLSFDQAKVKDKADGLTPKRNEFLLPGDIIYLDDK